MNDITISITLMYGMFLLAFICGGVAVTIYYDRKERREWERFKSATEIPAFLRRQAD